MRGLSWMDIDEACDLLRVTEDNAEIIERTAMPLPMYVEIVTGYPSDLVAGETCAEVVRQLCRFTLQRWFNPDGTDANQLARVCESLERTIKALVIAEKLDV